MEESKTAAPSEPTSNNRGKKRKFLNKVNDQMEFYFSDSNLKRDKFLRTQMANAKPFQIEKEEASKENKEKANVTKIGLPFNIFLNFNNIKAMTTNEVEVRNAIKSSKKLELFQVDDQYYVSRKDWQGVIDLSIFLEELDSKNEEFEKRTVYCEGLPIQANQQWLKKIFSQFGRINIISIPTFKGNRRGKIKQFCFVEFANEISVTNMLNHFKQFNGVLCYNDTQPNELLSIQMFEGEDGECEPDKLESAPTESNPKTENEEKPSVTTTDTKVESGSPKKSRKKKKNKKKNQLANEENVAEEVNKGVVPNLVQSEKGTPELNDDMIYDLKIMTKTEWRRLRNKYLNLQREYVKEMKRQYFMNKHSAPAVIPKPQILKRKEQTDVNSSENDEIAKPKRRRRGRERIKSLIKKNTHIFFEGEQE